MFMQQDWFLRQIEMIIDTIIYSIFGKSSKEYSLIEELRQGQNAELKQRLTDLLHDKQLGEAENQLFFELEKAEKGTLAVAIDFYQQANALSDEELEAQGFTRAELLDGLSEAAEMYGLVIPRLLDET